MDAKVEHKGARLLLNDQFLACTTNDVCPETMPQCSALYQSEYN